MFQREVTQEALSLAAQRENDTRMRIGRHALVERNDKRMSCLRLAFAARCPRLDARTLNVSQANPLILPVATTTSSSYRRTAC
jgi:hypothetical protein